MEFFHFGIKVSNWRIDTPLFKMVMSANKAMIFSGKAEMTSKL
jgi:hypothetical protein